VTLELYHSSFLVHLVNGPDFCPGLVKFQLHLNHHVVSMCADDE